MKWIILEGPDNIGKTTFCHGILIPYLATLTDKQPHYVHFRAPITSDPYNEQRNDAYDYAQKLRAYSDKDIEVNDRSIFGELVYSSFRGYKPDYIPLVVDALKAANIEPLFVVFYADKHTYQKFKISSKKETQVYESHDKSKAVSMAFINEIHKLKYGKVVIVNCNNYTSLDERNKYVMRHIRDYIGTSEYVFDRVDGYQHIPFNNKQKIYDKVSGFLSTPSDTICKDYTDAKCNIGIQHKNISNYGRTMNIPTWATGSIDMVDYIFVGEAPGQKGCGTFGIPFYGDISGNLFMKALYNNSISPLNCYITNIIKCCPQGNDLGEFYSTRNAMKLECVKQVKAELDTVMNLNNINKVYAIGNTSYDILTNIYKYTNVLVEKIYHPAYYVRQGISNKYSKYLGSMLNLYRS